MLNRIAKRIIATPCIWRKDGFKIELHDGEDETEKHHELHLHVKYKTDYSGSIAVRDGRELNGNLPTKAVNWLKSFFLKIFKPAITEMVRRKTFYRLDRPDEVIKNTSEKKSRLTPEQILKRGQEIEEERAYFQKTLVVNAKVIAPYRMKIRFYDGSVKDFDVLRAISVKGRERYFQPLIDNPARVRRFKIHPRGYSIKWNDNMGFECCYLYEVSKNVEE